MFHAAITITEDTGIHGSVAKIEGPVAAHNKTGEELIAMLRPLVVPWVAFILLSKACAFIPIQRPQPSLMALKAGDANEVVAARIKIEGDVQGGYYRACVKNEVRKVL
jgi:hypothetical protein